MKRTNGRCKDLASRELSFHCRISLHFAPSWLGGFIRLGRDASAPQIEGMSMGEDAGSPEETPLQLFPSEFHDIKKISRSGRKHIQSAEGMEGGDSMGALRIRTSSGPPGRVKRGRQRRPAAGVASLPTREDSVGFLLKFRFVASFTLISTSTNPVHRLGRKRCPLPWASPRLPRNNRARVAQAGPPGAGEGRGGSRRRGEPGRATRGEVRGRPSEGARPAASLSATPALRSCLKETPP